MKTKNTIIGILAPFIVAGSIAGVIVLTTSIAKMYNINDLHALLSFMPTWVIIFTGCANVITYVPIFIAGFITLGRKGAIGQAEKLRTRGAYKYLRNPMYAGVSFTLFGLGLIIGSTGIAAAGMVWLVICTFQSKMEEKALAKRFGIEYLEYKKNTPLFVPEFEKLIKELFISVRNI